MRMTTFAFPVRETAVAELRFPSDLSADELEDMADYIATFFIVERKRLKREPLHKAGSGDTA